MRKGSLKLRKFIKEEQGDGTYISLFFIMYIAIFIIMSILNVFQIYSQVNIMRTAANEVIQLMKIENGADSGTREKFNSLVLKNGSDPTKIDFKATPKLVQRGDELEIVVKRDVKFWAAKMFGIDYYWPTEVRVTGLAHKYFREGGG